MRVGAELELGGLGGLTAAGRRRAHAQRLGRGEGIEQHHAGVVLEQALLGLLAPHDPRRHDGQQAGQVPTARVVVQRAQDRLAEGVADDGEQLTPSRSMVSSSSTGSKVRFVSVTTEPPAASVDRQGKLPVPCIWGQAGRNGGRARCRCRPGRRPTRRRRTALPSVAVKLTTRSSWRHMTPLGMPVVPPV